MMTRYSAIFDAIKDVNKDLGEDLLCEAYRRDGKFVSVDITDPLISSKTNRHEDNYYERCVNCGWCYQDLKKAVLHTLIPYLSDSNTYGYLLKAAKDRVIKLRSTQKVVDYLQGRYGIQFHTNANGMEWDGFNIYPRTVSSNSSLCKSVAGFSMYFDKDLNVAQKCLDSYCRKLDKVIDRMKILDAAFGGGTNSVNGSNIINLCAIRKSGYGDWLVFFPYNPNKVYGENPTVLKKLMEMCRYKDTDYCLWRGGTPEEFEMVRTMLE